MSILTNKLYDEIRIGEEAELVRTCTEDDFDIFANASGNLNPMHLARYDGDGDGKPEAIAPALFVGSLVSAVLGNVLPGAGTLYRRQTFEFHERAVAGDTLRIHARVTEKRAGGEVVLDTTVRRQGDDALILSGEAVVVAPAHKVTTEGVEVPGLLVERHRHFEALLKKAEALPPIATAVVSPEEPNALGGALLAFRHTIITPILVGNRVRIEAAATELGASLEGLEIIETADDRAAAQAGVALVREGRAHALMKGHLHTDILLHACLDKQAGLRTGRRFTHVFVMDVPGLSHPLIVTDAAINIAPDLATKVDIVQNAIDVAISIGIERPKVGILSAVETVNPDLPSSLDGAVLSKMAERGQITGGIVDGPLAMDNAVDLAAARTKGIRSEVAGQAEILVVPNLDAGNMLAKQLIYVGRAEGAGLVLGAAAPIILNSRADGERSRLASCAVAALHATRLKGGRL